MNPTHDARGNPVTVGDRVRLVQKHHDHPVGTEGIVVSDWVPYLVPDNWYVNVQFDSRNEACFGRRFEVVGRASFLDELLAVFHG